MGPLRKPLNTFNEDQATLGPPPLPEASSIAWPAGIAVEAPLGRGFVQRELLLCLATQRRLKHPAFLELMRIVSRLGNGVAWYALIALIALSGATNGVRTALLMVLVGSIGLIVYKWLKKTTSRPRPCARGGEVVALTAALDEFSFPSGHTLHAVAFSTVAVAYLPILAWVLVPFTALIALSRVVLGLHYPSDVLAGASIGATLAAAVVLWAT